MKKTICFAICIAILVVLTSCGSSDSTLPKGEASTIYFVDGWKIEDATFEYINENTVKIVRNSDEQVFYAPNSSIDVIWVK